MTLGDYDTSKHHPLAKVQTLAFDKHQGQYKIDLKALVVDKIFLNLTQQELNEGQGVFIDSGTTLIHGPEKIIK